ncbi:bifunctional arginine demethylase and lysyl-hydroxylase JMJD6-like [Hetaerina americana]|uniref:bifunctional arginine demethylase and lysyl-hydroxylase JMJD6-like n=1 Tax=Hetaerina americana TaxID=62018 RepID=UPI003A7F392F
MSSPSASGGAVACGAGVFGAERRARALAARAAFLGVGLEDPRLKGAQRLLGDRRQPWLRRPWVALAAALAAVGAAFLWPDGLLGRGVGDAVSAGSLTGDPCHLMVRACAKSGAEGGFLVHACAVYMPDQLVKALRPPEDCSMCRGLTQVDKVVNISPAAFEERYAYTGRPVVVGDAMENWTARHEFSFQFFKELYEGSSEYWSHQINCQFFPYDTEFRALLEVFNMSEDRARMRYGTKPWYIGWSNCDETAARALRRHYTRPYFLPTTAESKRTDWLFMGSPGYGAHMHVDNVEHPSWQAQVRGSKQWQLQPPPECLYECRALEVTVHPGEIIVVDTNRWYHSTLIVSTDMSITIGAEYD